MPLFANVRGTSTRLCSITAFQHICGCAVGTIKSRVNRARTRLAELMGVDSVDEFGPDQQTRAVLASGE